MHGIVMVIVGTRGDTLAETREAGTNPTESRDTRFGLLFYRSNKERELVCGVVVESLDLEIELWWSD